MAHISIINLYDQYSIGTRIMSAILREAGHQANTIYFKIPVERERKRPHNNPIGIEALLGARVFSHIDSDEPWTHAEVDLLITLLERHNPHIIAISTRSIFDEVCIPLLRNLKTHFPRAIMIAGGMGPTLNPECYLRIVDFCAFGEGEETLLDIAEAYDTGAPIKRIQNLAYIEDGQVIFNPVREPISDLERYPMPEYGTPEINYIEADTLFDKDPATTGMNGHPILAGRGCIWNCSYCSTPAFKQLYRQKGHLLSDYRLRSIDSVIGEAQCIKSRGFTGVRFVDAFLSGPDSYMLEFFTRYKEEIGLPFFAHLNPIQMTRSPEILDAACAAGLESTVLGIQHGSNSFRRKYFGRNVSNAVLSKAASFYHTRRIRIEYHMISGIPFETKESLSESLDYISTLPMDFAVPVVYRLKEFYDSPLMKLMRKDGSGKPIAPAAWFFTSLLYLFRTLCDDELFDDVRIQFEKFTAEGYSSPPDDFYIDYIPLVFSKRVIHYPELRQELILQYYRSLSTRNGDEIISLTNESTLFEDDKLQLLHELTGRHLNLLVKVLLDRRITLDAPLDFFDKYLMAYLTEVKHKPVLIWGTGSYYERHREILSSLQIESFIDNDPTKHYTIIDGIYVNPPVYAECSAHPIIICSCFKKEIYGQIKERCHNIHILI